ncbi:MAG TPA: hypothetical protein PLI28_02800 [Petrotogaceae bacterium]|nr:hypothetical protein [Petrotogaceae bacterium]
MSISIVSGSSYIKKENSIKKLWESFQGQKTLVSRENYTKSSLEEVFSTKGMFSQEKLVIIKELDSFKAKEVKDVIRILSLADGNDKILITVTAETEDIKKIKADEKIDAALPKPWEDNEWKDFLDSIAAQFGKKIEKHAAEYLLQNLGREDTYMYEEISKISIYAQTDTITLEDAVQIGYTFSDPQLEDMCYLMACKKTDKVMEMLDKIIDDSEFNAPATVGFMYRYFLDLYKVILNAPGLKKYTWANIQKIAKDCGIKNSSRVRSFLGVTFQNDIIKKINLENMYDPSKLRRIIIMFEQLDRQAKSTDNFKVAFSTFFREAFVE